MKTKELYTLACILCFICCSRPSVDEVEIVKNLYPVQFSVQLEKEELPFSRSIPNDPPSEPTLPGSENQDKELEDLCTQIEYVVFQEGETPSLLKHRKYTTTDTDFGIVYDTLPKGRYQVCFLGHNSKKTSLSGNTLSFDTVPDSFYNTQLIEINPDQQINNDISLQRIVSRIEFRATDVVPPNIGHFDMLIDNYPNKLNLLTGKGVIHTEKVLLSHLFSPKETGTEKISHFFHTFIPSNNETITVHLSAIDMNDLPLRERSVPGITPQMNKVIRYSGRLYSKTNSDDTFQLSVSGNGEWGGTEEEELPD